MSKEQLSVCITCSNRSMFKVDSGDCLYLLPNTIDSLVRVAAELRDTLDMEIVVSDWASTDWPLADWLPGKLDGLENVTYKLVQVDRPPDRFSVGYGRNMAADHASYETLFFVDADMIVSQDVVELGLCVTRWGGVFFPQCHAERSGERVPGYGNACISKAHHYEIHGWMVRETWGDEDSDYHTKCQVLEFDVASGNHKKFMHQQHPKYMGWPDEKLRYNETVRREVAAAIRVVQRLIEKRRREERRVERAARKAKR